LKLLTIYTIYNKNSTIQIRQMKFTIKTTDALATQRLLRATNTAELPGMKTMGVGLTNNKVT
jgi:hypothetical protein